MGLFVRMATVRNELDCRHSNPPSLESLRCLPTRPERPTLMITCLLDVYLRGNNAYTRVVDGNLRLASSDALQTTAAPRQFHSDGGRNLRVHSDLAKRPSRWRWVVNDDVYWDDDGSCDLQGTTHLTMLYLGSVKNQMDPDTSLCRHVVKG